MKINEMKSILDPQFKYTSAEATDINATFARIRKEREEREEPVPAVFKSNRQNGGLVQNPGTNTAWAA